MSPRGGGTPSSASSCTGRPRPSRGSRPSTPRSASCSGPTSPTRSRARRTPSGTRTPCASRTVPSPAITATSTAIDRTPTSAETGRPDSRSGIPTTGPRASPRPALATWCSSPSTRTDTACGRPASATPTARGWHCSRDVVGEMAEAVRRAGMRFGVYYCGGLDWSFETRPMGSMAGVVAAIPRRDYPAYAAAQVQELIDRYRPSVLWNDVAWPAPGRRLRPLLTHYYEQVPDGVVNDRWLPWHPVLAQRADAHRSSRDRRGVASPGPPRRWSPPAATSPLRCPHTRVPVLRRHPTRAMGDGPWHGPELWIQRRITPRALHRPRRPPVDAHGRDGQGREPPPQRRTAWRRRADPGRPAAPPLVAQRMDRHLRSCDHGDPPMGRSRLHHTGRPPRPLHGARRHRLRVRRRHRLGIGDAARPRRDAHHHDRDHHRLTEALARLGRGHRRRSARGRHRRGTERHRLLAGGRAAIWIALPRPDPARGSPTRGGAETLDTIRRCLAPRALR